MSSRKSDRIAEKYGTTVPARNLPPVDENDDESDVEMSDSEELNQTMMGMENAPGQNRNSADPLSGAGRGPDTTAQMMQMLSMQMAAMCKRLDNMQQQMASVQRNTVHPTVNPAAAAAPLPSTSAQLTNNTPPQQLIHGDSSNGAGSSMSSRPAQMGNGALQYAHKPFELPEFNGTPEHWPVFIASYEQSTAAFQYSPLQNLFRLQRCLKGEARASVECLLINPDNIVELIDTLRFRFGRPEMLAQSQIVRIREQPAIVERNMEQLVPYSTKVTNMVAFLNVDATRHILSETTLLGELVAKLPASKKMEWAQHSMAIQPRATVEHFAIWLRNIAQCVSIMNSTITTTQPVQTAVASRQQNINNNSRAGRHVLLNVQSNTARLKCVVCSRTHKLADCNQFTGASVDERWAIAEKHRVCYSCLRPGHMLMDCRSKRACPHNGCRHDHHKLLHGTNDAEPSQHREARNQQPNETVALVHNTSTSAVASTSGEQRRPNPFDQPVPPRVLTCLQPDLPTLFRILPVTLHGPDRHIETYALLDDGSAVTLLDEQTSRSIGLKGERGLLNVQWFGKHSSSEPSYTVELSISGSSQRQYNLKNVRTVKNINLPTQSLSTTRLDENLQRLPLADYQNVTPKILIGLDNSFISVAKRTRTGSNGGPIAAQTRLGWLVYGPQSLAPSPARVLHIEESDSWAYLDRLIMEYHTTDSFGVKRPERMIESDDDMRANNIMQLTTTRVHGRYQTGLLWRADNIVLPDSMAMARNRLSTVERKMQNDPEYGRMYVQQIESYLAKGYARRLTAAEAKIRTTHTWYLPHFGVQTPNKPGKLRLVFDAAACVNGTSLNSALLAGPDLNRPLVNILYQFRMRRIGVCADIVEMYHQVGMQPSDRDAQRFLWRNARTGEIDEYEMCVCTFGATCSPTSAQYVKNINASRFEQQYPAAARAIRELHYVDDFVASFDDEEEAARVTSEVTQIHLDGGFVLRGFVSNSALVLKHLNADSDVRGNVTMELDVNATDKILGLRWCTFTDTFVFAMRFDRVDADVMRGERRPTKRQLLSASMSVFDPFGYLADFMLHTKLMVQSLWRIGTAWDEPVPDAVYGKWTKWCGEIPHINNFSIPRCYSVRLLSARDVQLHMFADASEEAFAAVGYWRIEDGDHCELAFIAGKVKCAPVKILSIPRLELQAAVMATRLNDNIRECHPEVRVSKTVMWTDSRTVQQWIRSTDRRFRPFVAHRVGEILDSTNAACWKWLPTKHNVADDATRSSEQPKYNANSRWIRGPAFLLESEPNWPTPPDIVVPNEDDPEEIRSRFVGVINFTGNVIDLTRFSDLNRLCRACAWALRFVNNARAKARDSVLANGGLTVGEIRKATDLLCILAQKDGYPNEYAALAAKQSIDRTSSLRTLLPYMDDNNIMRVYGRTDAANSMYLPPDAKRPIILPRDQRFTMLVARHHHINMSHQFEDGTICAIRQRYWVPKLRSLVRNVQLHCNYCKLRKAQPNPPVAGQLPVDRLTPNVPAFHYTGLDYFGPVQVTVGRRQEKRWIALFTCLTIRAVHMEVASDLSTDSCLLCIRNFCNIRGVPSRIRSDCGTNFVGADGEIRRTADFLDQNVLQQSLGTRGIEWLMNCPGNPEAGGAWERLVQSTKRVLAVTLKSIAPRVETLRSLVIEAANILNSRPLTNVPINPNDLEPLTPNHFLIGRANSTTSVGEIDPKELCNRKQWRVHQQLMRQFWRRWIDDYLPELTRRGKFYKDVAPVAVGSLVLVCDANVSRGQWTRGRVENVTVGTDGRIRTAEVRTSRGLMRRPLSKLAVLDVENGVSQ